MVARGHPDRLAGASECGLETVEAGMVPISHTVGPSVCRLGTMEAGMVPISHTVGPSVCRLGKVPGGRRPPRRRFACARLPHVSYTKPQVAGAVRRRLRTRVRAPPLPVSPHKAQRPRKRGHPPRVGWVPRRRSEVLSPSSVLAYARSNQTKGTLRYSLRYTLLPFLPRR